jgi:hypothetical protein
MDWVILGAVVVAAHLVILSWRFRGDPSTARNQGTAAQPQRHLEDGVDPRLRPLVRQLSHDMPLVIARAAKALGESGHPDAVLPLIRALAIRQRSVHFAVVDALLALGSLTVDALQEARDKEPDPELQKLMTMILEQLKRIATGLAPVQTGVILERPPELIDEMIRDLMRG